MCREEVFLSSKIALHDYRSENSGRGVIATEPITVSLTLNVSADSQKNELLFTIPTHTTLSARTSSLQSQLPALETLDSWLQLILAMLYENQSLSSPWKQYFSTSLHPLPPTRQFTSIALT